MQYNKDIFVLYFPYTDLSKYLAVDFITYTLVYICFKCTGISLV